MKDFIATLIEAWSETKVQKVRVIISLIGVVAAVAAMSIVTALGNLMITSVEEAAQASEGRDVTVSVEVSDASQTPSTSMSLPWLSNDFGSRKPTRYDASGRAVDPVGQALDRAAQAYHVKYYSKVISDQANLEELSNPSSDPMADLGRVVNPVQVQAVDPNYQVIFRQAMLHGRWLTSADADLRANPVVITETLWKQATGSADLSTHPKLHVINTDGTKTTYNVVGVTKENMFSMATMFVPYQAWLDTSSSQSQYPKLKVWTDAEDAANAREYLRDAVAATLGTGYTVASYGGENGGISAATDTAQGVFTTIIMIIGIIVISLGSLGLLNVAVVTVRQRVREIGIRRALGASARRIFFAVFMESVVATSLAGALGVIIAIITLRVIPLETFGIYLQQQPGFPMTAALIGVLVSTGVGALCGLIPAWAAVRIKPIEAIRY